MCSRAELAYIQSPVLVASHPGYASIFVMSTMSHIYLKRPPDTAWSPPDQVVSIYRPNTFGADSDDVNGSLRRDVNKVGAQRRWYLNDASDYSHGQEFSVVSGDGGVGRASERT